MDEDSDYMENELVEPFDIDGGELHGLDEQLIFCLGVEWQTFRTELDAGREIVRTVLPQNVERFKKMCARRGRICESEPLDDQAMWAFFRVEGM
jgi:hypothetical protein